jgi:hypothetical protein
MTRQRASATTTCDRAVSSCSEASNLLGDAKFPAGPFGALAVPPSRGGRIRGARRPRLDRSTPQPHRVTRQRNVRPWSRFDARAATATSPCEVLRRRGLRPTRAIFGRPPGLPSRASTRRRKSTRPSSSAVFMRRISAIEGRRPFNRGRDSTHAPPPRPRRVTCGEFQRMRDDDGSDATGRRQSSLACSFRTVSANAGQRRRASAVSSRVLDEVLDVVTDLPGVMAHGQLDVAVPLHRAATAGSRTSPSGRHCGSTRPTRADPDRRR